MKIYHFTNKNIKTVEVKHFGENIPTINDTRVNKIERSFFYFEPVAKEEQFKNKKCYVADVNEDEIYDLSIDNNKIIRSFNNIDDLFEYIRSKYKGIIYKVGEPICILFHDIKVKEYKEV